jgi:hypothetical protein
MTPAVSYQPGLIPKPFDEKLFDESMILLPNINHFTKVDQQLGPML